MKTLSQKIKELLHIYRREALIFMLLLLSLLCTLPENLHEWNSAWYAMDYSLGMDSRLLIGSLLSLLYPDFLPAEGAYTFVLFSILLMLVLLSYVLGYALRQLKNTVAGTGLLVLLVFYLLCPGAPAYLWTTENMGRFDLYLLLITLMAAVFFLKISSPSLRLLLFTLTGIIALSIHQVFLFVFFPLLFTMYLETAGEDFPAGDFKKPGVMLHILLFAGGMVLLGVVFLYFQFFSHIKAGSYEELAALLMQRTDLAINEVALRYEYFSDFSQSVRDLMLPQSGERIRYGLVTLFLLSPLAVLYGYLWFSIIRTAAKKLRFKYMLLLLSHLCFVPAFLLTIDWGRWFGAFLTVQALQLVLLAAKKDAPVLTALSTLGSTLRKHPYVFIGIGLWMASLGKFQATLLPDAPVFFASLYKLYAAIF